MGELDHGAAAAASPDHHEEERACLARGHDDQPARKMMTGSARFLSSQRSLSRSLRSISSELAASVSHLADTYPAATLVTETEDAAVTGETEPPDGGYGWVVVAAAFLASWGLGSMFAAFSILYVEWTDYFQSEKGVTGWIGSLYISAGNFLSFAISILVRRYGCRKVTISGSVIAAAGLFASALAPSVTFLYLSFGLVYGVGQGMMFLGTTVIVAQYFTTKRPLAAGIAASGLSMGVVTAGPLTQLLIDVYGWRGAMVIWSGVYLNCCVFGALYRPLPKAKHKFAKNIKTFAGEKGGVRYETVKDKKEESSAKTDESTKTKGCSINSMCDLTILRNPLFVLYIVGTLVANLGVMPFYQHTPGRAIHMGIDRRKVSFLPTIIGTCTATSRIVFGFVANMSCTKRTLQYSVSIIFGGCILTSYALATTFPTFIFYCGSIGILNGAWLTIQTTILADLLDVSKIALSQSFICFANGVAGLLSIPFAGFLFDVAGDYDIPFYVCGPLQALGGLILLCIPIIQHCHKDSTQSAIQEDRFEHKA